MFITKIALSYVPHSTILLTFLLFQLQMSLANIKRKMELFCTENYVPICYLHSSLVILSKMNYDYDYYMPIECGILFV